MSLALSIDREGLTADIAENERRLKEARDALKEARRKVLEVQDELAPKKQLFEQMFGDADHSALPALDEDRCERFGV